jgi:lysine 2,3-aminomutase
MECKILKPVFPEKISPFLIDKMEEIRRKKGEGSADYTALLLQYKKLEFEDEIVPEDNKKHWEADVDVEIEGHKIKGIERLYKRSLVIEPTLVCATHCRYCLRAHYGMFTLSEAELKDVAKYCGSKTIRETLREVLITGGDPFILPQRLHYLVESIVKYAPNVKTMRIATRLITHDPNRIDNNIYAIFKNKSGIRFEMATQINHAVEFFPETIEKIRSISRLGVTIYSQNVLLKGVNDDAGVLAELYDKIREHGIEPHYLFHCVPMKGMRHLRTSLEKGLFLIRRLVNSGIISGRVKPIYAVMTDIGKITLYEGTILRRNDKNQVLLQSDYSYEDRIKWNPNWKLPKTSEVDKKGYLRMWYLDGSDC